MVETRTRRWFCSVVCWEGWAELGAQLSPTSLWLTGHPHTATIRFPASKPTPAPQPSLDAAFDHLALVEEEEQTTSAREESGESRKTKVRKPILIDALPNKSEAQKEASPAAKAPVQKGAFHWYPRVHSCQ